ncbi:MAG: hypothetical protein ABIP95_12675 [Pelobium sp.]
MNDSLRIEKLVILYVPWLLSLVLSGDSTLSYLVAWAGSLFIFYWTLTGKVRAFPNDLPVSRQLMRPLFLVQVIFAGYMASTSIFYFLSVQGYENFTTPPPYFLVDINQLELVAQCQRYYALGHAAFVSGILLVMQYPETKKHIVKVKSMANFLMLFALITLPVSTLFLLVPGLRQFYFQLNSLSFIAGTLALAFAIPLRKLENTVICSLLYAFNFAQTLVSGFKEPIIISILVLGIFLYPFYKRIIIITFIPLIFLLFVVLPTYNQTYRAAAWNGDATSNEASDAALDAVLNSDLEDNTTWGFLTGRLSEIQMFTKYAATTPFPIPYYGFTFIQNGITVIVPRIFWPAKPITEDMVMERVYNAGVVTRGTKASAKPALVVDGFLSGGMLGVFLTLLAYGFFAQKISIYAEKLFGGYILGTALMYSGLFQILWRGLSFEFIINSVFWSFVTMLIIYRVLLFFNILQKA